jgi:HNH endonuclease
MRSPPFTKVCPVEMREIPLTNSDRSFVVDGKDYEKVVSFSNWHDHDGRRVISTKLAARGLTIASFLMGTPADGYEWDHIDGNPYNNVRSNLRLATRAQQNANRSKPKSKYASSRFKGVRRHRGKWEANIGVNGRVIYLGLFSDEILAAEAYDIAAEVYHGEFARKNF